MYEAYQAGQSSSWSDRWTGATPGALLVLAVGGLGTPKRALQIRRGREGRLGGVDPAGEPRRDLLDQPRIAVGIGEGEERPVAGALGVDAGLPRLDGERRAVPHVAHVDAAADEFVMGRFDVGDDQPRHGRARRGRRESLAERDRGPRARGRELDDAKAVQRGDVVVEPPTQALVELLGSVDVGHGDDVDLELHVDLPDARVAARGLCFGGAHVNLLVALADPTACRPGAVFATTGWLTLLGAG